MPVRVGRDNGGFFRGKCLFEIRLELLVNRVLLNVINYAEADCFLDRVDNYKHTVVDNRVF